LTSDNMDTKNLSFDYPFQVEEHFLPESDEIVTAVKETIDWQ